MRRLPPNKIEQNLNGLLNLIPEETDELLQRIDQPLKEETCPDTVSFLFFPIVLLVYHMNLTPQGRKYLICDYNRDGDCHR
jgi:capping protein beta